MTDNRKTNRLINESSPYLLQHAHNPVDWYPWNNEALSKAKTDNRLILVSIGYSSCHWCHVMERESFEDERIAELMNTNYVSIKVDREERPDIDSIYQLCAQMMGVQGGWPLTAFLTPDLTPVFIGTYFPPRSMWGRPGFTDILTRIAETYREKPDKILEIAETMSKAMKAQTSPPDQEGDNRDFDLAIIDDSLEYLADRFDSIYGGFGEAPKFPNSPVLQLMMESSIGREDANLHLVLYTLDKMAQGGIYDHLGGGFHRYSTDKRWLIPHFEKMLYDNALLVQLYLDAYKLTGKKSYATTAFEVLNYLSRDMTSPEGAIYSTEDADSEGEEGRFYVWTKAQIIDLLGTLDGEYFCELYGVTEQGNFENNASVLSLSRPAKDIDKDRIKELKAILLRQRAHRIRPFRDEKIIAAWNGMAISAFAKGGATLKEGRFIESSIRIWKFIEQNMVTADNTLIRSYMNRPSSVEGFLEDYAYVVQGLLDLYEATFDKEYIDKAKSLMYKALEQFWSTESQVLYDTRENSRGIGSILPIRHWDYSDGSIPNGAGVLVESMLKLRYYDDEIVRDIPESVIGSALSSIESNPWGYCTMSKCLMRFVKGGVSVVLVEEADESAGSDPTSKDALTMKEILSSRYIPSLIVDRTTPADSDYKLISGRTTAYVCKGKTCFPPVNDASALGKLLQQPLP